MPLKGKAAELAAAIVQYSAILAVMHDAQYSFQSFVTQCATRVTYVHPTGIVRNRCSDLRNLKAATAHLVKITRVYGLFYPLLRNMQETSEDMAKEFVELVPTMKEYLYWADRVDILLRRAKERGEKCQQETLAMSMDFQQDRAKAEQDWVQAEVVPAAAVPLAPVAIGPVTDGNDSGVEA
jgi:hypothetical protein